ncbi:MAG: hypothetical protein KDC87_22410 [Planctomycetes bacterium]|nr:hypothetical protein [Planctomycetota bacterium]
MRWLLAGLAFALLVVVAVFTVAIKSHSLLARARIAAADQRIQALRVEAARRAPQLRRRVPTRALIERLHSLAREIRSKEDSVDRAPRSAHGT